MLAANLSACALFELVVMGFQVVGVTGLCLTRLLPTTGWGRRGRLVFIVSLIGLGIFGALCGHHDSEFGLFAGGTMTVLLIGMTIGGGSADPRGQLRCPIAPEPHLAS